jgi:hypothetical protein
MLMGAVRLHTPRGLGDGRAARYAEQRILTLAKRLLLNAESSLKALVVKGYKACDSNQGLHAESEPPQWREDLGADFRGGREQVHRRG